MITNDQIYLMNDWEVSVTGSSSLVTGAELNVKHEHLQKLMDATSMFNNVQEFSEILMLNPTLFPSILR